MLEQMADNNNGGSKKLVLVVDGTAAMGPHWQSLLSDYVEKIVKSFCGSDPMKQSAPAVELALIVFNAHGCYSSCLVQRSGWTRHVDFFSEWLSSMSFTGGGFNEAAIAEGLGEALMILASPSGNQTQQSLAAQKHCILVAANNPYPLPTPVYRPPRMKAESDIVETQAESRLSDAETLAKCFAQHCISLSVICPKQLPKLRAIYNAGKRNPQSADPSIDNVKSPYHLVLISENFIEARAALSRSGVATLPSNQSPIKMDANAVPPVSAPPPTSMPSANVQTINRPPASIAAIAPATVKVEPTTVSSVVSAPTFQHTQPPVPRAPSQAVPSLQTSSPLSASQEMIASNESVQDLKPVVSVMTTQTLRPVGPPAANVNILNNLSQARLMNSAALAGGTSMGMVGLPSIGGNPMAMHMSNMISSGMAPSVPATQPVISSGQSGMTTIAGSGTAAAAQISAPGSFNSANSNISGSQAMGNLQGGVSMGQPAPGMSQSNLSGPQMVQSSMSINQNMSMNQNGASQSSIPPGNSTMMPTPGISQQAQQGVQALGVNNNTGANLGLSQQSSGALQSAQSKYVKVWEGNLSGQRQGQPVFITRLEGYRSATASETLAANWPPTMQIVRLISQDHMNNKQYVGKADFLVFRAMNQHGFLGQLQEKKLCAVIQLPSQTLLLSVSDKACRLIGMLFPGDMVVFKPQISGQQPPQLQPQQHPQLQQLQQQQQQQMAQVPQQQQQMQQQQQQPPQQQQQQQQQMAAAGIGQAYVQGPGGRSQLVSQGPISSQGPPNVPGGGFLN